MESRIWRPRHLLSLCVVGTQVAYGVLAVPEAGRDMARAEAVFPAETAAQHAERLQEVARRRAELPILVHRGATRFAPENSVAAFKAAMDHGADGVELDIRCSKDGILYLFHDDTLDRMTDQTGKVQERTFAELQQCRLKGGGQIPRLTEALQLARERRMLLHLDVKEPGLQDALIRLLEEADVWQHLVEVNAGNAERIRNHAKVRLLQYKGWLPQETPPNWTAIEQFFRQEGNMVFCRYDPALAVEAREKFGRQHAR